MNIFIWPWPLIFIWPWVLPLTLAIWRNSFFFHFLIFFEVMWRKNVTSYVKTDGRLQKRHSIRNVLQPTRSLYHFRFKSYGPLCYFYKSGDLDLDRNPNFTKELCQGTWTRVHQLYKFQKDRTSDVACTPFDDGQTSKQTDRLKGTQRVHTLQNWTYRLSDLPCRLTVTKVKDTINWS